MDYTEMGTIDLRRLVRERGLANGAAVASARKDQLIALLEGNGSLEEPRLPAAGPSGNGHDDLATVIANALKGKIAASMDAEAVGAMIDERLAEFKTPAMGAEEVQALIREAIEGIPARRIEVKTEHATIEMKGQVHVQFEELAGLVSEGHRNLLMVGPAGSGKTTLARNLAESLGLDFGFISLSAGISEVHLFGRTLPQADGSWAYRPSRFVEIYEKGGVFLFDEMDAADSNVMVSINAALANGHLANPNGQIHTRHEKCYIIGAANTWGRGADAQYVGRNQLDAATIDRFVLATIKVGYDTVLEEQIAKGLLGTDRIEGAPELLAWIEEVRRKIECYRLRRVASTRLVVSAAKALAAGKDLKAVKARYFLDWSADEKAKVE